MVLQFVCVCVCIGHCRSRFRTEMMEKGFLLHFCDAMSEGRCVAFCKVDFFKEGS